MVIHPRWDFSPRLLRAQDYRRIRQHPLPCRLLSSLLSQCNKVSPQRRLHFHDSRPMSDIYRDILTTTIKSRTFGKAFSGLWSFCLILLYCSSLFIRRHRSLLCLKRRFRLNDHVSHMARSSGDPLFSLSAVRKFQKKKIHRFHLEILLGSLSFPDVVCNGNISHGKNLRIDESACLTVAASLL